MLKENEARYHNISPKKEKRLTKLFERFTETEVTPLLGTLRRPHLWFTSSALDKRALNKFVRLISEDDEYAVLAVRNSQIANFPIGEYAKDLERGLIVANLAVKKHEGAAIEATLRYPHLLEVSIPGVGSGSFPAPRYVAHDAATWPRLAPLFLEAPEFERVGRLRDNQMRSVEDVAKQTLALKGASTP